MASALEGDPVGRRYDCAPGPLCVLKKPASGRRQEELRGHATPPEQAGRQIGDYTKFGFSPGGDRPIFTRCRKIFLTSSGSVITAITFIGAWQRGHSSGSTSYTWAISLAQVEQLS